jgi:tetratricopeptide (TPR) repeat protein
LPEDDSFLGEASSALKDVIFADAQRATWQPLLLGAITEFVIQIAPTSRLASLLPFELISIDGCYLVDVPGLKIVREIAATSVERPESAARNEELRILHVSLGTDPILELGKERALLLSELPGIPVQFLMSPSLELLLAELDRFQPTVVHISSHGVFDVLAEQHETAFSDESHLYTDTLLRYLLDSSARVVFLASCQSALFAVNESEEGNIARALEIAGFAFPVESDTARSMMVEFYRQLRKGSNTGDAVSVARNANLSDVFSSFSLVHYRPLDAQFTRFVQSAPLLAPAEPYSFISSEEALLRLDSAARTVEQVVLLSPLGFGARTLLREWKQLQEHSTVFEVSEFAENRLIYRLNGLSGIREIGIIRFFEYDPIPGSAVVIVGEIGDFANNRVLDDSAMARAIDEIGPMAAEIPRVSAAIMAGASANNALQSVIVDNRLDSRLQVLGQAARQLVQELIGLGGVSNLPLDPQYGVLSLSGQELLDAEEELRQQRIAVELERHLILSPEIMFLADGLFPGWKQSNERQLRLVAGSFAIVHENRRLTDEHDFNSANALLQWSSNLGCWDILHELILICQPSHAAAGRSTELIGYMKLAHDHLSGEKRMIHAGNFNVQHSQKGTYAEGLREHQKLQQAFESLPEGSDRTRNILAAKTHRMDLLIRLGKPDEALEELPSILQETKNWTDAPASAEAHVFGLFAEAYRAKEDYRQAAKCFGDALSSLQARGASDENPIFLYSLSTVLLQGDDVNGALAVFAILENKMKERPRPELLSNFYHLKGRLMSESHDPEAIKYLLKSLELDLEAGQNESALVSLLTVINHAQFSDDRNAIRSILPLKRDFAKGSEDPKRLRMVAELEQTVADWDQERT